MRLWSLHPKYLDTKGLLALWREGLLAQKVLMGKTKGYRNHPQLIRFKENLDPIQSIVDYLHGVCDEADQRGYLFSRDKILKKKSKEPLTIKTTQGQMTYELTHLKKKLFDRDKVRYKSINQLKKISSHPLFKVIPGDIADWEKIT